jgi:hypothetical protein
LAAHGLCMPDDLLLGAREQTERAEVSVRAAALLQISRVETASDRGRARITFEMALEEIRRLKGRNRDYLFSQARWVAAAVAPELLREIPSKGYPSALHDRGMLVGVMLQHNLADAAFKYVMDDCEPSEFSFDYTINLIRQMEDESAKVAVVRRAVEAWRATRGEATQHRFGPGFINLFGSQWNLLPAEEARSVAREIVRVERERADETTSAGYPDGITFTSRREHTLFEILHVLRELDPVLAEMLIADHEQLAAAVLRFPNGRQTMIEENEERRKKAVAAGESRGGCFIISGGGRDREYHMAMMQASKDGDFGPALEHALEAYREDAAPESPNGAPKAMWPSTSRFRSILYSAGRRVGRDAAVYLDRIPDGDLRLFAQIELAAALAGLPELGGTQAIFRPPARRAPRVQREPMRSPDGASIRCPQCEWMPSLEDRWGCKCGHIWNTFSTGGVCPGCQFQWKITMCWSCGEVSPHADWYVR